MFQLASSIQSAKSSRESAWLATAASLCLTSDSRIMASLTLPTVRVDVWTLRCHFNRFRYYQRGQAGEIDVVETRKPRQPTAERPYVASVESYYRDKRTGIELARTHH